MVLLLVDIGNSKPIYDATQLRSILNSYCRMIPEFPEILGIHIYDNKEGKVLQLELESMDKKPESIILAIVVGIFLHLSTTIIFETSENHKVNLIKLLSILSGFALAFFSSAMH